MYYFCFTNRPIKSKDFLSSHGLKISEPFNIGLIVTALGSKRPVFSVAKDGIHITSVDYDYDGYDS